VPVHSAKIKTLPSFLSQYMAHLAHDGVGNLVRGSLDDLRICGLRRFEYFSDH
jgi:hypothetical protein